MYPNESAALRRRPGVTGGSDRAARGHDHAPRRDGARDRYAAVVAALMDVRPDEATARFDAEVSQAVADGRLDATTARALRWWQQASVRAAESYATTVVPGVLAVRDEAEAAATRDAAETAAAWRTALDFAPEHPVAELAAVRLLAPAQRSATPERTRQAIRAAFTPQPSTSRPSTEVDFQ